MALKNTKLTPLLNAGTGITLTSNGQIITINSTGAGALPAGTDTQVQFNDGGALGADSGLTYNKTLNVLGLESIDFGVTPTATTAERRLLWDNDEGSLNLTLKGGLTDIAVGAEVVIMCYNAEATTLNKGEVVYLFGSQGQRPSVKRASNTAESTSSKTFGMVAESIASGANGFIMQMGIVRNMDTSAFNEGDILYLGSTAGSVTTTAPTAPSHQVFVGVVLKKNASSGRIYTKPQNGYELGEIHNVALSSLANNEVLTYESSTSLWKNKSISTILGYTPEQPLTFSSPLSRATNTISIPVATSLANGYLSSTDWSTFNGKQAALSGSGIVKSTSGTISYISGTSSQFVKGDGSLDSSSYLTGSSSISFSTDVNTIGSQTLGSSISVKVVGLNGVSLPTLSTTAGVLKWTGATGTWVLDSNTYITSAITSLNSLTSSSQTFAVGTSGTDFAISSATSTHTFNLPTASATNRGALSSSDWSTFNNKQSAITLTTTGSSGASTFVSNTLNIPNYTLAGLGGFANPMTTLGDIIYGGSSGVATRLAGSTSSSKVFLSQTGTGTISAIPAWSAVTKSDVGLANVENTALSTWAGSTNIITLGTIATGTWSASTIAVDKGGTGATTLTGVLIGNGTSAVTAITGTASQLLRRNAGNTAYEFFTPTYLTSAITSLGGLTASTQTFANDTNVTITSATSTHTLGWSGQLSVARGGTGLSALGTGLQLLRVNSGATALEYFTPTYLTSAITSLGGLTASTQTFATGTSGTDFAISSVTSTHTFNLPTASATNRGALSSADWSTFNGKQSAITLTTTGSSGSSTFVSNTLNIPTYTLAGLGGLSNPMTTLGDMIYGGASGATTRLVGQTTTAKQYLSQTGTGTASAIPVWATIAFADISGTLAISAGGTGQTTATAAFDALSPTTTLGDIIYHNGTDNVRLAGNTINGRRFLRQTGTGTVSAAPVWDTLLSSDITGSALTKTDDTNVTLTLGGSASSALLNAASLTLGWSGQLSIARGGTNSTATPTNGGISYGTGTAYAFTSAGTSGQALISSGASAPTWTTLTLENLPGAWVKKAVDCATTAALTLNAAQTTIDGITISASSRVLVKNQATASQNGIYTNMTTTSWTRATDADTSGEIAGGTVSVDAGTTNAGIIYTTNFKSTDTLGTTAMNWYRVIDSSYTIPTSQGGTGLTAIGTALQVLRVNSGATGLEYATISSGGISSLNALTASTQTFANDTNVTITSSTSTHTLGWSGQLALARGGTGVSSVTTSPTATAFAGWDANKNLSANNFLGGYTTTATAAGTTTLVVGSSYYQYFTGTTTQTIVLPVVTTLVNGFAFRIVNLSTGNITINTSGGNAVQVMGSNTQLFVYVINTAGGTGTASWDWNYSIVKNANLPATIAGATTTNALAKFNSSGGLIADSNITDTGSLITLSALTFMDIGVYNSSFLASDGGTGYGPISWTGTSNSMTSHFILNYSSGFTTLSATNHFVAVPILTQTISEASSGTHSFVSQLAIKQLTLNDGLATTTNAATLYVEGATNGTSTITNNYSLWVDDGVTRLDGTAIINGADATTNSVKSAGYFQGSLTTGTPAIGIGTSFAFNTQTAASNYELGSVISSISTNVTSTTEAFDLAFANMTGGATATERMRLKSTGQLQLNAYTSSSSFTGTPLAALMTNSSGNVITVEPVLQVTNLTISATAVQNAFTTPITLIAAQGAGKVILPVAFIFKLDSAGTAFATNTNYQFQIGTTAIGGSRSFSGTTDAFTIEPVSALVASAVANLQNQALVWKVLVGNPTGGTGATISIGCVYSVLTI